MNRCYSIETDSGDGGCYTVKSEIGEGCYTITKGSSEEGIVIPPTEFIPADDFSPGGKWVDVWVSLRGEMYALFIMYDSSGSAQTILTEITYSLDTNGDIYNGFVSKWRAVKNGEYTDMMMSGSASGRYIYTIDHLQVYSEKMQIYDVDDFEYIGDSHYDYFFQFADEQDNVYDGDFFGTKVIAPPIETGAAVTCEYHDGNGCDCYSGLLSGGSNVTNPGSGNKILTTNVVSGVSSSFGLYYMAYSEYVDEGLKEEFAGTSGQDLVMNIPFDLRETGVTSDPDHVIYGGYKVDGLEWGLRYTSDNYCIYTEVESAQGTRTLILPYSFRKEIMNNDYRIVSTRFSARAETCLDDNPGESDGTRTALLKFSKDYNGYYPGGERRAVYYHDWKSKDYLHLDVNGRGAKQYLMNKIYSYVAEEYDNAMKWYSMDGKSSGTETGRSGRLGGLLVYVENNKLMRKSFPAPTK